MGRHQETGTRFVAGVQLTAVGNELREDEKAVTGYRSIPAACDFLVHRPPWGTWGSISQKQD